MTCTVEKVECFNGTCEDCSEETIIDTLIDSCLIDTADGCSWTLWKKLEDKYDLQHVIGSIDFLLTTIEDRWPACLLHTYCNRQQTDYVNELRSRSSEKILIIAQIDSFMNTTLIRQGQFLQEFFSQHQAILFTYSYHY